MRIPPGVETDDGELCVRHGIVALALFGSALDGALGPDSDIDLLATLAPDRVPGLISPSTIELALGALLGRRVVRRTANDLNRQRRGFDSSCRGTALNPSDWTNLWILQFWRGAQSR